MTLSTSKSENGHEEVATLAGGCFWCLDATFRMLRGVQEVVSGYTGGHVANPDYYSVGSGDTGHAEAVQVHFDPSIISYRDLLEVFFTIHDPTTLNRQGADTGTQYRSAIYYHAPEQKQTADQVMAEVAGSGNWRNPLVTELKPLGPWYEAEEYHQRYFERNPNQGYCRVVIVPKVAKLRQHYLEKLK
jgi:peptide-methionine (S)-S-oxide reductase